MKKALFLTGIYWDETFQRHQQFAEYLADNGYTVYFVEHIVSSKFKINTLLERIVNNAKVVFSNKKKQN